MGQTLQAEYYKEAINVNPTYSLAHFNNGVILIENVFLFKHINLFTSSENLIRLLNS